MQVCDVTVEVPQFTGPPESERLEGVGLNRLDVMPDGKLQMLTAHGVVRAWDVDNFREE